MRAVLLDPGMKPLEDLAGQDVPVDAPHPVLGCRCAEGRLIPEFVRGIPSRIRHWLPPVHDCAYIEERNRRLGLE
jgi:hypothetical protein